MAPLDCPFCEQGRQWEGQQSIVCPRCLGTGSRELGRLFRAREIGFREGIQYVREVCSNAVPSNLDPESFYRILEREEAVDLEC